MKTVHAFRRRKAKLHYEWKLGAYKKERDILYRLNRFDKLEEYIE